MNGDTYDVQLSAEGLGNSQLNFAERSLQPQFSIWEALASSKKDGFYASVTCSGRYGMGARGWRLEQRRGAERRIERQMSQVTITIVENGQTLSTTVSRNDRTRVQVIGQDGQSNLVRIQGQPIGL